MVAWAQELGNSQSHQKGRENSAQLHYKILPLKIIFLWKSHWKKHQVSVTFRLVLQED